MRLPDTVAWERLAAHDHGVLCTVHPDRGVDAVPVVYTGDSERRIAIPVDRVKPKQSTRLQRVRNLEADPRAALLIDCWDRDDWTRLWWVRAELRWDPIPGADVVAALAAELAARYVQYRDQPFETVLVFQVLAVTGWSGAADRAGP